MKLRYYFIALLGLLAFATSCEDDTAITQLKEVQVSSSYVALPAAGGSVTTTVNATDAWEIKAAPEWLTIAPTTGAAGATDVKFTAEKASDSREATVELVCAGKTQLINVIQMTEKQEVPLSTCAEVLAGPESKTYRVKGVCTGIANTQYGNWYINDGTGEVYIYGTVDAGGAYNWASFGIEVGDIVTVEGPKTVYNGTVELVDAAFISVTKSLLKVEPTEASVGKDGGEVEVKVVYKGQGLSVEPQCDWVSLGSINVAADTTVVVLKVDANTGDPRTGNVVLKSAIPSQTSEATITVTQAGVSGTLATPFTVAQAIDFALANGGTTAEDFYVKGKVSKVLYTFSANYGTGTFWISDDGEFHGAENGKSSDDKEHDFECYSVYWFGNQPWVDGNAQVSVGDEVIICGKLTVYNGLAETSSKAAYVYSVNGLSDDSEGLGSLECPFTAKGAIAAANAIGGTSEGSYYIKGICSKILYTFSADYGTGTFWLSDDGQFNGAENGKSTDDKGHDFECYSVYWFDNQPWVEGNDQVEVGDEVTVYGQITLYNGVAETASKKAYVYSVNKK